MKVYTLNGADVLFWIESGTLFCRLVDDLDVYCCGSRRMPETEAEALDLIQTAWIW